MARAARAKKLTQCTDKLPLSIKRHFIMCGRFARYQPLEHWLDVLSVSADSPLFEKLAHHETRPRYNIAPGTDAWVVELDGHGELALDPRQWAFPTSRGNRINVRSETAH
ncbi:MAG: SOS response-associated peptidase, partial [Xanthomonadales bacterium]|nr:SOS response-associated peptidase [Xanthomonadales bacterium]